MANGPRAMIKTDRYGIQLIWIEADQLDILPVRHDRPLAKRHRRNVGMMRNRFRDNIDGVRVIKEARLGADPLHVFNNAARDMDRAQRHKEATRPLRLLADHAVLERNALIQVARLEAS